MGEREPSFIPRLAQMFFSIIATALFMESLKIPSSVPCPFLIPAFANPAQIAVI